MLTLYHEHSNAHGRMAIRPLYATSMVILYHEHSNAHGRMAIRPLHATSMVILYHKDLAEAMSGLQIGREMKQETK